MNRVAVVTMSLTAVLALAAPALSSAGPGAAAATSCWLVAGGDTPLQLKVFGVTARGSGVLLWSGRLSRTRSLALHSPTERIRIYSRRHTTASWSAGVDATCRDSQIIEVP